MCAHTHTHTPKLIINKLHCFVYKPRSEYIRQNSEYCVVQAFACRARLTTTQIQATHSYQHYAQAQVQNAIRIFHFKFNSM